jgi:serine/threonine-protein kinase
VLGNTPAAAGSLLSKANLSVGTQTMQCSSQFGNGLVMQQSPAAGTDAQLNSPVNLVISTGACVTVPSVVGDTQAQASSAMTQANLSPVFTTDTACGGGTVGPGTVDSQTPAASAQVSSGSTVNMTVCEPSGTTTTTTGGGPTTTPTT